MKKSLTLLLTLIIFSGMLSVSRAAEEKNLLVGIAKVNITPAGPIKMAGYSTRPELSNGIHDSLYARILVFDLDGKRFAIISCELAGYRNNKIYEVAKKRFNIPDVLINCIHTHSGPDLNSSEAYSKMTEQKIISGLESAVNNMVPSRIAVGYRAFSQLGYNRLIMRKDGRAHACWVTDEFVSEHNREKVPYGPVDPEVGVIKITDLKGQPRVVAISYACHAVVNSRNYQISADYPGVAIRQVEKAYDGKVMGLFLNGGSGNIDPLFRSTNGDYAGKNPTDYTQVEKMGSILADNVITLSKQMIVPDEPASLKIMHDSIQFNGRFDSKLKYNIHFVTILMNEKIAFATFPGEPFVKFQLFWKQNAEVPSPVFLGYTSVGGDNPGYVPDIRAAAFGGYGADNNPRSMEVGAGERIMNRQLENLYRLSGIMRSTVGKE